MYLKELTINGFKSFAKKAELEFSTPITAIVGPNGSGKSNVAESFRFVLGEQSPSKMRGKKGEDLIFNGSESSARANRASVAITLNNEKKVFPLDFDEIVVERVVHRDGTNEYSINGSRSRLKDVQELFAAANIGSTGHHIISQGEADRILSANPHERREMIEDALGLKVYQYRKNESEKKLKKTLENIAQVESLRREVAPHLSFLERQVKKIERSLALREELKTFYADYLTRENTYLAFHFDRLTSALRIPTEKLKELETALGEAKGKLEQAERDEKTSLLVELETRIADARRVRQTLTRDSDKKEGQITFLERFITEEKQKESRIEESPVPYRDVESALELIERSVRETAESGDVSLLRRALTEAGVFLRSVLARASEVKGGGRNVDAQEAELEMLRRDKGSIDTDLASLSEKEASLESEYNALRASIEAERSEGRDAEREVFRIMNEQRELEARRSSIEHELRGIERDREEFKRELQEAVALIGSSAGAYLTHQVVRDGVPVSSEAIAGEDRREREERRRVLEKMKIRFEELGGAGGDDVIKEYTDVKERDAFLAHEIEDLRLSVEKLEELIADLTRQLNEQFIEGIEKIDAEFSRFFELMFGGGTAKLIRVAPKQKKRSEDDLALDEDTSSQVEVEEGIEIDVKLPNKRVRGLDMLSGGERALTSIALIFAMSQVNPPLFVILDETDAALDEANSRRYGDMIEALAKRSQLILITHNRETMGRAGVLYGVTMGGDGMSKLLSVRFEEAVAVAK